MVNKKWAYKKVAEFDKLLELGEDGWEVIGFHSNNTEEIYILKKEIW